MLCSILRRLACLCCLLLLPVVPLAQAQAQTSGPLALDLQWISGEVSKDSHESTERFAVKDHTLHYEKRHSGFDPGPGRRKPVRKKLRLTPEQEQSIVDLLIEQRLSDTPFDVQNEMPQDAPYSYKRITLSLEREGKRLESRWTGAKSWRDEGATSENDPRFKALDRLYFHLQQFFW